MLKYGLAVLVLLIPSLSPSAHASTIFLRNSTVDGSLFLGSSSVDHYGTSSTINGTTGTEFTFHDSTGKATYSVNFTNAAVTIKDICDGAIKTCKNQPGFTMVFTDPVFSDFRFLLGQNDIGLSYTITGDTLTLTYAGSSMTKKSEVSVFAVATPEPSSIAFLGTGLLGIAGAVRRRRLA